MNVLPYNREKDEILLTKIDKFDEDLARITEEGANVSNMKRAENTLLELEQICHPDLYMTCECMYYCARGDCYNHD